ncbi:MAG: ABC transporter [Gordonia sp.]|nr:ABC transporter [Gordonia sp. (in: high G+C Gram-positive bacteria)]
MKDSASGQASAALDVRIVRRETIPLDVTLDCAPGELLALVGPSGSGKTSVLRAIAGLLRPDEGRVVVGGETWFSSEARIDLAPQRRKVGLVFQDYALFPHLSALDTVALAVTGANEAEKRARAHALLERVNLDGLEARRPSQLSGGQRQRVALARALAREPRVLLMDEPFSAVDQATRDRLKRELASLRRSLDIPIVLVTHDLQEAVALADRMSVLYRGSLLKSGTPDEVRLRPGSALVARLMGQTNLFEGVLDRSASGSEPGSLSWRGRLLVVGSTGLFKAGDRVVWLAPIDHVILHRRARPSGADLLNPVAGVISELVPLGERTEVTLRVTGDPEAVLNFNVATRTVANGALVPGSAATVSLLPEGLHLMSPGD